MVFLIFANNLFSQRAKDFNKVPATLEQAMNYLDRIFNDSVKINDKIMSENEFVTRYLHSIDGFIARKWLHDKYFWEFVIKKSKLPQDLSSKGVYYEVDMIDVILRSYYRHLNNLDILLENQVDSIVREYENGKRIPMMICFRLISVNFLLTTDISLRYDKAIHRDFKILNPLLVLNSVIIRDSVMIDCFRNKFDKRNIKSIKSLSKIEAEKRGLTDISEDGVLLVTTKKGYYFDCNR